MPRYIPMPAYPDRMPIDISFAFGDEKPAGKHGFCKAVGEDFCFEDGTPVRFWGVNFDPRFFLQNLNCFFSNLTNPPHF